MSAERRSAIRRRSAVPRARLGDHAHRRSPRRRQVSRQNAPARWRAICWANLAGVDQPVSAVPVDRRWDLRSKRTRLPYQMNHYGSAMRDGPLLTAVIVRKPEGWRICWADIPFSDPGGAFDTLDWLVQSTDALVSESRGAFQTLDALVEAIDALVLGRDPTGVGTLQYKIPPWGRPAVGDERLPFDVYMIGAPGEGVPGTQGPLVTRPWVVGDGYETVSEELSPLAFHIYGNAADLEAADIASGTDLQLRAPRPQAISSVK